MAMTLKQLRQALRGCGFSIAHIGSKRALTSFTLSPSASRKKKLARRGETG